MKLILNFSLILLNFYPLVIGTVWLRYPNDRGPAAVQAGYACLHVISVDYFYDPLVTRSKNMVILHTANMSAPAAQIEITYLSRVHDVVAKAEDTMKE